MWFLALEVDPAYGTGYYGGNYGWTEGLLWVWRVFLPAMFSTPAGAFAVSVFVLVVALWVFWVLLRLMQRFVS